jgi:hypothetical protein
VFRTLSSLGLLVAAAGTVAAAPRPADIGGTWVVEAPPQALRTSQGAVPPLLPAAAAAYAKTRAALAAGDRSFDGTQRCLPPGTPRVFLEPQPFEILVRPYQVTFLFQFQSMYRLVYMTDAQPELDLPRFMGQSIGRWDGDTLVIDTIGFKAGTALDASGLPHSENLHLTERLRLVDGGRTLENRIRIDDPQTYSTPWETTLRFRRQPGVVPGEDFCADRLRARAASNP